jgi:hypothetical protein
MTFIETSLSLPEASFMQRMQTRIRRDFLGQPITESLLEAIRDFILEELWHAQATGEVPQDLFLNPEVRIGVVNGGLEISLVNARISKPPPLRAKPKEPRAPSTPPDHNWSARMSPEELRWIWDQIKLVAAHFEYVDNVRAARIWKSSDRKRFRRLKELGCCGSQEWIARRWNSDKGRVDIFLLGFNHGH